MRYEAVGSVKKAEGGENMGREKEQIDVEETDEERVQMEIGEVEVEVERVWRCR